MINKGKKIVEPKFTSHQKEATWWEKNGTDYWAKMKPVKVHFSNKLSSPMTVRFDQETIAKLQKEAKDKGVGVTTLVRMWIFEKLKGTNYKLAT